MDLVEGSSETFHRNTFLGTILVAHNYVWYPCGCSRIKWALTKVILNCDFSVRCSGVELMSSVTDSNDCNLTEPQRMYSNF